MNDRPTLEEITEAGLATIISTEAALLNESKTAQFALSEAKTAIEKFRRNVKLAGLCVAEQHQAKRDREAREAAATPKTTASKKGTTT